LENLRQQKRIKDFIMETNGPSKSFSLWRGDVDIPARDKYTYYTDNMTGTILVEKHQDKPWKVIFDVTIIGSGISVGEFTYRRYILEETYKAIKTKCGIGTFPEASKTSDRILEGR
jgi:hypothetical protein